jgi:hypothetical protein
MDVFLTEETELEATREEDQDWLLLKEENLIFNEGLVSNKFNDLDEEKEFDEEEDDDEIASTQNSTKEETKVYKNH